MATSSTPTAAFVEPALRLSDILNEEYDYIHGPDARAAKATSRFELVIPDKLIARLTDERQKMGQRSTGPVGDQLNSLSELTPAESAYAETPYSYLADWLDTASLGLNETDIKTVLEQKVADKNLLASEIWLLDKAVRPYTRGLVKWYLKAVKTDATSPTVNTEQLRQLLLEDAFVDYVKPQENSDLSAIFSKMLGGHQAALCLSGGGIRSATFALGIVQGLAQHDLLGRFTYLSTVSGGGVSGRLAECLEPSGRVRSGGSQTEAER